MDPHVNLPSEWYARVFPAVLCSLLHRECQNGSQHRMYLVYNALATSSGRLCHLVRLGRHWDEGGRLV